MDRRDFGEHIGGLVLGIAASAGLDTGRLRALLLGPPAQPAGTRRIGEGDIEVIEEFTAGFRRQDFAGGSGLIRDAALAQVQALLPLLDARIAPELRPRLLLAIADLAAQAGWMNFVGDEHETARRLWMTGLELARHAEHPQSTDLTVYLLADLALQAVHLGRPKEAVHLARIGDTAAIGRNPISTSTAALLASIQAQSYAAHGDATSCDRALGQSAEYTGAIDPATAPPWTAYLPAHRGLAGWGTAHYTLAMPGRNPRAADQAVSLLSQAVDRYGPSYVQLRGLYLPDLAGSHALAGDTGTAVTLGHQAVELISGLSAPRLHDRLRILNTVLQPLHTSPGVAELRERITATAA